MRRLRVALLVAACALVGTCSHRPGVLEQAQLEGELRVVTRNSPTSYYLGAEGPEGPEFDLARRFASSLGLRLRMIVVDSPEKILVAVETGRAHLGAAGLSITPAWSKRVAFSLPYQEVQQHVIYRQDRRRLRRLADLGDGRLEVVAGSAHAEALRRAAQGIAGIRYTERDTDALELLSAVSAGRIDYTVADANEFALGRNFHPELRIAFNLDSRERLAWLLPRGDRELAARVNEFMAAVGPGLNAMLDRYYRAPERLDYVGARDFIRHVQERLPKFRAHFQEAAAVADEDWRLLAAMGYQESKWDPAAISPTGVRGIMMLQESTATALGVRDRADPRDSILGGARYLKQIRDMLPARVPEPDRTWLALAAYNLGYGHLEDGRIITQMNKQNPDSWQAVRSFLPLLGQERWYSRVKRGYARGWEAVRFVDNVRNYLDILEWLSPDPDATGPIESTAQTTAP